MFVNHQNIKKQSGVLDKHIFRTKDKITKVFFTIQFVTLKTQTYKNM